jgi:hypothetical protein
MNRPFPLPDFYLILHNHLVPAVQCSTHRSKRKYVGWVKTPFDSNLTRDHPVHNMRNTYLWVS